MMGLLLQPAEMLIMPSCTQHCVKLCAPPRNPFLPQLPMKILPIIQGPAQWPPPPRGPWRGLPLLHCTAALITCSYGYAPPSSHLPCWPITPRRLRNGVPMTSYEPASRPETKSMAKFFSHRCQLIAIFL